MASEPSHPSNTNDDKPQNSVTELVKSSNQTQQDATVNPPSAFMNSEPMREEQVQNAVKFLSHPRVRGSPVIYRRSFLEKKGLTKEEIDEAFRRVPDPPQSVQETDPNQEGQVKPASSNQPSATTPVVASPSGGVSSTGTIVQSRFHWYHAVFAVGILAVSGAGTAVLIKNAIIPWLKSWIRKVAAEEEDPAKNSRTTPSLAEETAAAAKAAAASVADVAKASKEMLNSKIEDKRYLAGVMKLLDAQLQEMKLLRSSIDKLEVGQTNSLVKTSLIDQEDHRVSVSNTKQIYANEKIESDSLAVRSPLPSSSAEPSVAPHPKSYMEIMAMVQRGEKPPNIRDINDQPPNPYQPITNPRLAPRTKPWEVSQGQNGSSQVFKSQPSGDGINNKVQNYGGNYQFNVESTAPWWQQTAKITEIKNDDDVSAAPYDGRQAKERLVQRSWVSPQPPFVAMPEAAEAIRRPKPSVQKEQSADSESLAPSADATNDIQETTKVSESGGAVEIKGGEFGMDSSEIQEEEEQSY